MFKCGNAIRTQKVLGNLHLQSGKIYQQTAMELKHISLEDYNQVLFAINVNCSLTN